MLDCIFRRLIVDANHLRPRLGVAGRRWRSFEPNNARGETRAERQMERRPRRMGIWRGWRAVAISGTAPAPRCAAAESRRLSNGDLTDEAMPAVAYEASTMLLSSKP